MGIKVEASIAVDEFYYYNIVVVKSTTVVFTVVQ